MRKLFTFLCAIVALPAFAGVGVKSVQIVPSADGILYSRFPDGDAGAPELPADACDVPSGWACNSIGAGGGEIIQQSSSEWLFNVYGTSNTTVNRIASKDGGGADVELTFRVTDSYSGSTETTAALGGGIRESTSQSSWQFNCHSLQSGASGMRCQYGDSAGGFTTVQGPSGQSRALYFCIAVDKSLDEVVGLVSTTGTPPYTEVVRVQRALANDLAFLMGSSGSLTVPLQGTVDNINLDNSIDCYDDVDPPGGAPTLTTDIANQSLSKGISMSLCVAGNFLDEDSISASGIPSGSGLSFNTSNDCVTGTPNATDVSNSPYTVTFTATNGYGSISDTSLFTVSSNPGNTLAISSGTSTVDCDTFESGGAVDPGDILQFPGGTRGPITIRDCHGTAAAPIVIRNDPTDSSPATIRGSSGNGTVFSCINCTNVELDGSGGYIGVPSGLLGVNSSVTPRVEGRTQAGIIVTIAAASNRPAQLLRFSGFSSDFAIRGVEVDGLNHNSGGAAGICFSMNDHSIKRANYPAGTYRENILVENNYAVNCGGPNDGEGFYFGANLSDDDVPLRNVTFRNNLVDNPSRDCINVKDVRAGNNFIQNNHVYGCGQSGESQQNAGLAIQFTANFEISGNFIGDTGGDGMSLFFNNQDGIGSNSVVTVQNNIIADIGNTSSSRGHGIHTIKGASQTYKLNVLNNTIAGTLHNGINCEGAAIDGTVKNNILAGIGDSAIAGSACSGDAGQNTTGSIASQYFDTYSNNGDSTDDDFHLTTSSPARNAASTGPFPATDFDGDARPQQTFYDRGADEYVP